MSEPKVYKIPSTKLIPNSGFPLIHYPGFFETDEEKDPLKVHELYKKNGWDTQWIFRYGPTQRSHYHSQTHEAMAVLSGTATIRFGVADTAEDMEKNTHGDAREEGGIEVQAKAGDVFVIPAGVSHKTFDTTEGEFGLLTPGGGHDIPDVERVLKEIKLDGFTMIGAYPRGGVWDFAVGGEHEGQYDAVWSVPKPPRDPVMGEGGISTLW